jgi:hypothetical protein
MKKLIYVCIVAMFLLAACKKTDKTLPIQAQEFEINSTSSTLWKYFSFSKNDTIAVADPATSTDWDLAFQRYRIRTNSNLTGGGQGSAANSYQKLQTGFDALKIVPDTATFIADASVQIAVQQGYATYIVNPVLYNWFSLELGGTGTQIVPTDYIYFIKTATGKYAKVWFKGYYNSGNQSGYVTFRYKYQPDGSKNIE